MLSVTRCRFWNGTGHLEAIQVFWKPSSTFLEAKPSRLFTNKLILGLATHYFCLRIGVRSCPETSLEWPTGTSKTIHVCMEYIIYSYSTQCYSTYVDGSFSWGKCTQLFQSHAWPGLHKIGTKIGIIYIYIHRHTDVYIYIYIKHH